MSSKLLYEAVRRFAGATLALPEYLLGNPAYRYDAIPAYEEVRYAFLHTTLELRQLAARLHAERVRHLPQTQAQYALAQHHAAFRDFEALLLGVDEAGYTATPAPEEWPLRIVTVHVHEVERYFFAAILNTLRNRRPQPLDDAQTAEMVDEPAELDWDAPLPAAWSAYAALHSRILHDLAGINDGQLALRSPAWEPEPWPTVEFRLHRFETHLREHANQVEKSLAWLQRSPSEARLLLRQVYAALAEAEGLCIGAPELGTRACAEQAQVIDARLQSLEAALQVIRQMIDAVTALDSDAITRLVQDKPDLAYTQMPDGMSCVLYARYRGRGDIVQALLDVGLHLTQFEAAALGQTERLRRIASFAPKSVNEFSRDGFTPLQLACFFGHEETALALLELGADVHAVARNPMRIQPLHAAVAGRQAALVQALIARGADVNARQQDDFTPLMAARQNRDQAVEELLLTAGAVA